MRHLSATTLALAALGFSSHAAAQYDLNVVYVNLPGHPTNSVPGLGVAFNPGSGTTNVVRPWVSQNELHWGIEALAQTGSTATDNVYIVDGTLKLQEGTQAPWTLNVETVGPLDDQIGIDNAGNILFGNNTTAATNDDYIVLMPLVGSPIALAQEAGPIGPVVPALAGTTFDDGLTSCVMTAAGIPGWEADGIDGAVVVTENEVLILGSSIVARNGVTIPPGQGFTPAAWDNFDPDDFEISADGLHTLIQGDTSATTTNDQLLVYDGNVVLQENVVVPGSGFANPIDSIGINQGWMDEAGNWYARGTNDVTLQDWIVRNGVVIATGDALDPIVPSATEHWDDTTFADCFFCFDGNALGQFVFGGVTDAPSTSNGVVVFDDGQGFRRVVLREGDPVDVDGNGQFDDGKFWHTFGDDDILLTDSGVIWFTATLRDSATGTTGANQGLFKLTPVLATATFRNGTGVNAPDYTCNLPVMGSLWTGTIATNGTSIASTVLIGFGPDPGTFILGGEILIALAPPPLTVPGFGAHNVTMPTNMFWLGAQLSTQGFRIDTPGGIPTLVMTNAQDLRIGK